MERAVGKNEKLERFAEVGKSQAKLERTERSWKEPSEVGKLRCSWKISLQLESFAAVEKFWLKFLYHVICHPRNPLDTDYQPVFLKLKT